MRYMKFFFFVMFVMVGGLFVWFIFMCVDVILFFISKLNCRLIKYCVVNELYLILNLDSKLCILVVNLFR